MIRALLAALGMCMLASLFAQRSSPGGVEEEVSRVKQSGFHFLPQSLFSEAAFTEEHLARVRSVATDAMLLHLEPQAVRTMLMERPEHIALHIPNGAEDLVLELYQVGITANAFSVISASTQAPVLMEAGLHYRGIVEGAAGSVVAISVYANEVMGMIASAEGTRTLGLLDGDLQGTHVLYSTAAFREPPQLSCSTQDEGEEYSNEVLEVQPGSRSTTCVRFYWEVDHAVFLNKGGLNNTIDHITGLFNQSAALFSNDGIDILLSELFVWDVPSPYTGTSSTAMLNQFGNHRTSFNGDLAHLLGFAGGGGMAYLNGLCEPDMMHRMAYSGITSSFQSVPTYSWSVQVVTHEQGHQLGSRHTHACAWNGNNTPIDGCGQAAGYVDGNCATGPIPATEVGGTIMSYCHLSGTSVNFANGFGPQPRAVIINSISDAACLGGCDPISCDAPGTPVVSSLSVATATISWPAVSGAISYDLQYKTQAASLWTEVSGVTTNGYQITGLAASTNYLVQVKASCAGGGSAFSVATPFTTPAAVGCDAPGIASILEVTTSVATIQWPTVDGAMSYVLEHKLAGASNWIVISGLHSNTHQLVGLLAGNEYQVRVKAVCVAGTSIPSSLTTFSTRKMVRQEQLRRPNAPVIDVYPNPVRDQLTIAFSGDHPMALDVLDVTGRVIDPLTMQDTNGEYRLVLNVSGYTPGIYLLRATGQEGEIVVERFVVE